MRTNYEKQTDITKDSSKGKVTKHHKPAIDFYPPNFVSPRVWCFSTDYFGDCDIKIIEPKSAGIKTAINELKELFCKPFKREIPPI